MLMVVSTTISDGRMVGTVTLRNIRKPLTPSIRAASTMSSGIALIDADSTVIAKPGLDPDHHHDQEQRVPRLGEQEPVGVEAQPT